MLIALLKTRLPTLPTWDVHDWLLSWPALALACGLPLDSVGKPCVPSSSQLCKRWQAAGAPPFETLFVLTVWRAVRCHLIGARDLIIDSTPILAWRRTDPDAATGHAPAHHPRPHLAWLSRPYPALSRLRLAGAFLGFPSRASMMPPLPVPCWNWQSASPPSVHASSAWMPAIGAYNSSTGFTPRWELSRSFPGIRSDKRTALACRERWTKEELGKRSSIERFFGRLFLFFRLQRPAYSGWSAIVRQVALTYTTSIVVALAAWQFHRPDLIRSPKRF